MAAEVQGSVKGQVPGILLRQNMLSMHGCILGFPRMMRPGQCVTEGPNSCSEAHLQPWAPSPAPLGTRLLRPISHNTMHYWLVALLCRAFSIAALCSSQRQRHCAPALVGQHTDGICLATGCMLLVCSLKHEVLWPLFPV